MEEYCAGKIAEIFENLGGEVVYFGKPHKEVYLSCLDMSRKTLVIGDNLKTDIKGANNMKFDSLFITQGIHKLEFDKSSIENYDQILKRYEVETNYYQKNFDNHLTYIYLTLS